jgi:hypothetical protein
LKENAWQRQFQGELGMFILTPTLVYEDNTATITMATTMGTPHKRVKHFDVEWNYAKQAIQLGEAKLVHVGTDDQAADMMTKALPKRQFQKLRDMVMGGPERQTHFDVKMISVRALVMESDPDCGGA